MAGLVPWKQAGGCFISPSGIGGTGTYKFQDPSHEYHIQQICINVSGGTGGLAVVEVDGFFICGTNSGALDSADGDPAIILPAGSILSIQWANIQSLPVGGNAVVTLIGVAVTY
jgi:hypothetical protein